MKARSSKIARADALRRSSGPAVRVLLALGACVTAALAACASSGSAEQGDERAVLVALRDYRQKRVFELASESHTDRVEYYSHARKDAARKIQSDEVMGALLEELERQGLEDHEKVGPAPSTGAASSGVLEYSLEIERGSTSAHWLIGQGTLPEETLAFQQCAKTFLELYNVTLSLQSVENPEGRALFDRSKADAAARSPR